MNTDTLRTAIEAVTLPDSRLTVGSEKALRRLEIDGAGLQVALQFGLPVAHVAEPLRHSVQQAAQAAGWTGSVHTEIGSSIQTHKVQPGLQTIAGVKNIIAIASGKGGVGKSTTTANLAVAMQRMGARVGVLDADLYGPSQPTMLGVAQSSPQQQDKHLIPVRSAEGIQVMSIGFLVDTDQAVCGAGRWSARLCSSCCFTANGTKWIICWWIYRRAPATSNSPCRRKFRLPARWWSPRRKTLP